MGHADLLSRKEAAAYLRISLSAFLRHVAPHVAVVRVGRLRMFRLRDLDGWIDSQAQTGVERAAL